MPKWEIRSIISMTMLTSSSEMFFNPMCYTGFIFSIRFSSILCKSGRYIPLFLCFFLQCSWNKQTWQCSVCDTLNFILNAYKKFVYFFNIQRKRMVIFFPSKFQNVEKKNWFVHGQKFIYFIILNRIWTETNTPKREGSCLSVIGKEESF